VLRFPRRNFGENRLEPAMTGCLTDISAVVERDGCAPIPLGSPDT